MTKKNEKKKDLKKLIIFIVILVIVIILFIILRVLFSKEKTQDMSVQEISKEITEKENDAILEKLYKMDEQQRMTYYCAQFFKLIDTKHYEETYNLLYDEYKEKYFPTLSSFKKYVNDYFPEDVAIECTNMERLGDIYVLWVDVKDAINGSIGHNFSMYVIIQENDYNDYVLSFSRNSAVDSLEME